MANVIFNENTGVEVPDTLTVRTDIENGFKSAFQTNPDLPVLNTDPVTPMGQVIDLITAEAEAKNTEVAFLCNMMNILTAGRKRQSVPHERGQRHYYRQFRRD